MRLYETLSKVVRWRWLLKWYLISLALTWFIVIQGLWYQEAYILYLFVSIAGTFSFTSLAAIVVMSVFGRAIYGTNEKWTIIWPFRIISEEPIDFDSEEGLERRLWCYDNLRSKWIHCRHGYFAFKRKDDAMAFKLRWL